ncbi:MAG: hypothetical protein HKM05_00270, partial [Spirochaetales bacterium]|nr:hypothetical protein [Spirochaetales bacterium]
MNSEPVGLSDLAVFAPQSRLSIATLAAKRIQENPDLQKHLDRALATTGQQAMRFPQLWEDTITLGAEALRTLLSRKSETQRLGLRYLTMGTETSVDMSKAGSSYLQGLMAKTDFPLPANLASFQVQQACAGGSLAALTLSGSLKAFGHFGDSAVVVTSDIARYTAPSTAEVTQGAGATALWLETSPQLLEFDLDSVGLFSKDVDDFFRPLGSTTAKVRGGFSLACYHEAFLEAFADHCRRAGVSPQQELASIDAFCLHVPYAQMPVGALEKLFTIHTSYSADQIREHLTQCGFFESLVPAAQIGNLYTGSLWLSLAWSLHERSQVWGSRLAGKKYLLASYGSGNTMAVWTAKVAARAKAV